MLFTLILACSIPTVSLDDTAPRDTASTDTAQEETAAPCVLLSADPVDVTWAWPDATPVTVTLTGCADPLVTTCPPWVIVHAPESIDGVGAVDFAISPAGQSADAAGVCTFNEVSVAVALDIP